MPKIEVYKFGGVAVAFGVGDVGRAEASDGVAPDGDDVADANFRVAVHDRIDLSANRRSV